MLPLDIIQFSFGQRIEENKYKFWASYCLLAVTTCVNHAWSTFATWCAAGESESGLIRKVPVLLRGSRVSLSQNLGDKSTVETSMYCKVT